MLVQGNYIDFNSSRLHYAKAGQGTIPLLIFPGYGQTNRDFEPWVPALAQQHRIFVFDLYFHGQSAWNSNEPLNKEIWKSILERFLQAEGINEFELVGFSLGGKFALASLEAFPEKTKRLILIAPDGIRTSIWYGLATSSSLLRLFFRGMIKNPKRFKAVSGFAGRTGLVAERLRRFADVQMETEEKRRRVYSSWVFLRRLRFRMTSVANALNRYSTPLLLIVGKYDKVTPPRYMSRLLRKVGNNRVEVLNVGHAELIKRAGGLIGVRRQESGVSRSE